MVTHLLGFFFTNVIPLRRGRGKYEEGEAALHGREQVAHLVDALASHLHAVDLEDLVALVKESGFVRRATSYNATYLQKFTFVIVFRVSKKIGWIKKNVRTVRDVFSIRVC